MMKERNSERVKERNTKTKGESKKENLKSSRTRGNASIKLTRKKDSTELSVLKTSC